MRNHLSQFLCAFIIFYPTANAQLTPQEQMRKEQILKAITEARSSSRAAQRLRDQIIVAQEQVDFAQAQLDAVYDSTDQKIKEKASHITLGAAAIASGIVFIKMLAKAEKKDFDTNVLLHGFSYIYGFLGLGTATHIYAYHMTPEQVLEARSNLKNAEHNLRILNDKLNMTEAYKFDSPEAELEAMSLAAQIELAEIKLHELEEKLNELKNLPAEQTKDHFALVGTVTSSASFIFLGLQKSLAKKTDPKLRALIAAFAVTTGVLSITAIGVESPMSPAEIIALEVHISNTEKLLENLKSLKEQR